MDQVKKVEPKFLWFPWLPRGKLVILDGQPEVGKSTISQDLMARITTGASMPDGSDGFGPATVVILSAEDDLDDSISWRLEAAGADLARVHAITHVMVDGQPDLLGLPTHTDLLIEFLDKVDAALLVMDVFMSYVDDHIDTNADAKSRRVLQRLKNELREIGCTALLLRHPRKAGGTAINAGGGSIAFTSAVRAAWFAGYHPDDHDIRVLASTKNNMARPPPPLQFSLLPVTKTISRVEWNGPCPGVTADQLADPSLLPRKQESPALGRALQGHMDLVAPDSTAWISELEREIMAKYDVSKVTVKRARDLLGWPRWQERHELDSEGAHNAWRIRRPRETFGHVEHPNLPDIPE
jgi:hypothetical protein